MSKNEMSSLQKYLWIDQKLTPKSPKYNIGGFTVIDGCVDFQIFEKAVKIFIDKHNLMKSTFNEDRGNLFMFINENDFEKGISYFEINNKQEALKLIEDDFKIPFDIENEERLYKIWLIRTSPNTFIWYTKLHHLIADGYSFQILFNEVSSIYKSLENSEYIRGIHVVKKFEECINEEKDYFNSKIYLEDKEFWKEKYINFPKLIFNSQSYENVFFDKELYLSEESLNVIETISKQNNVSTFHILLAGFSVILSKFYFTDQVNIGTPIFNRLSKIEREIFAPFINLLPLQVQIEENQTFIGLVKQIKGLVFSMLRHQKFQQPEIIKAISFKGNRLYDVRVSYENFNYQRTFSNFNTEIVALSNYSEDDPISVHIMDYNEQGLKFRFDINGKYVPVYVADELISSLQYLFDNLGMLHHEKLEEISITTPTQKENVLSISFGNISELNEKSFPELWRKNIGLFSTQTAVIYNKREFTYLQVDEKIKKVIAYLKEKGIKKGDRIGVLLERSENTIPVILGVLELGAVYVPMDKLFPIDRISYIVEDSNIKHVLTDEEWMGVNFNFTLIENVFEGNFSKITDKEPIFPQDEAYIIYTSGTTGKPKGVSISHESLIDYALSFSTYFDLTKSDRIIQQSSFVFDTSIEEIFPILSIGGTLIISKNPKDFHGLLKECSDHHVTLLSTNPFVIQYLNENFNNYSHTLRIVISGGDVISKDQVSNLLEHLDVYNTYGPTESTVCATYHKITIEDNVIPIGKPIFNRKVFIVNNNKILPKGALGEIVLGGKGIAKGYINNDKLSKDFFVDIEGEKTYKTGDLGQWNKDGELFFCGRKDKQLSFKGYRIEREEIEEAIKSTIFTIKNCLVTIKELENGPLLIAYLISDEEIDEKFLFFELKKKLPVYMIPNHIVVLKKFPLNTSGKIDNEQLPLPKKVFKKTELTLPLTDLEKEVAIIWKKLLNLEEVDIYTSFFEFGGHSLLANQFIGIIRDERGQDISLKEFYEAPTIHEIVKIINSKEVSNLYKLEKAPELELYPLSFPQERLWFLDQLNKENKAYYVPRAIRMKGVLEVALIEKTFTLLIEKHEILRTVFPVIEGVPFQKILPPYYFHIPQISLIGLSELDQEKEIENFILKEGNLDFDLEKGPLLRVYIIQKEERENVLVFCEHHLIHDGWTQGILLREFIETYTKLSLDPNYKLLPLDIQFKDFSYWQKTFFDDHKLQEHIAFWKERLEGHLPVLELPQKNKRPNEISGKGELLIKTINKEISDKIRTFSLENNSTLFITMLAAFKITLCKFSNETDICVGTAVANRRLASLDNMLGMIINTIALRTKFDKKDSLRLMLEKVKNTCFETYSYEDTPFGKVVEHIAPIRNLGLMPLFQYAFSFMNTPSRDLFLPNLELNIVDSHNRSAKFDINIVVVTPLEQAILEGREETNRTIIVEWEYNSDIYSEEVMSQMFDSYFEILEKLVLHPETSYDQLSCLDKQQKNVLLNVYNDTKLDYPDFNSVIDLFKIQVEERPNSTAINHEGRIFTYQEIEDLSNALANHLLETTQIKIETLIGVELERSEWLVISLLAILKTGGAYVPIDPSYPKQRIDFIKEDSQCAIIITNEFIKKFLENKKDISVPKKLIRSNQLAYVIYTSGSTGKPKGVMIEHRNLINLCFWHKEEYDLNVDSRSTLYSSVAFDASVWEIFPYLCFGGCLFPISDNETRLNIASLSLFFTKNKITHCYLPSKIVKELNGDALPKGLKILAGGEALTTTFIKGCELYNNYGPTENTVVTTNYLVTREDELPLPIGKPIANTKILILDEQTRSLQPKGVIGEICISGKGLSRGYLNLPKLTSEKFIQNPFDEKDTIYRTGDLGRWLSNGNIDFVGRIDNQVKIRGYRIELGEIESVLIEQNNITEAFVDIKDHNDEKLIIAYLVSSINLDIEKVKYSLDEFLPQYMIPNHLIQIDELPITPNGKVDKKALSRIVIEELDEKEYIAPRNEIEKTLVRIWQEILKVNPICINDNFFKLGGHSLKVTQLINKINKELLSAVKVKDVFTYPTIAMLSEKIKKGRESLIPVSPISNFYPLSSSQKRLWVLSQFEGGSRAYNIPGVFIIKGILNINILSKAFLYLIKRHDSLRTKFVIEGDDVYQQICNEKDISFTINNEKITEDKVKDIIKDFYDEEFDLTQAPLLKVKTLETEIGNYYLLFSIHHIIGDGWSIEIFTKELMYIYNQLLNNLEVDLNGLRLQYKDYVSWLDCKESQDMFLNQETYWREKLKTPIPVLELPSYKKRPLIKTYNGATKLYDFSKEICDNLKKFNEEHEVTLYMTLLSAINGLFYKYTDSKDIILGAPIAGRSHSDLENIVGLFLNTLAIRTTIDHEDNFKTLLKRQKEILLEAYDNQDYPFDKLVEILKLEHDTSRSALFDVLVVLQNQKEVLFDFNDFSVEPYNDITRSVSQFDMTFSFSEDEEGLHLRLEYNTDIYFSVQIDSICKHLENFLEAVLIDPEKKLDDVLYLSKEEEKKLLVENTSPRINFDKNKTILDLFSNQVLKAPHFKAIVLNEKEITYLELEEMSNAIANDLLSFLDIQKETFIGVELGRTEWLIISLIAVLKTGGAYVSIDPSYPKQRIDYIKEDSNCAFVINQEYIDRFECREKNLKPTKIEIDKDQLAYIIYTSGSTGNPKGVMIEHKNVMGLINWSIEEFPQNSFEIVYFSTSHCFDLSIFEIFYPLSIGKTIRIVENGLSAPAHFEKDKKILFNTVPSVVQSFLEEKIDLTNISVLNMAGEIIPPSFSKILPLSDMDVYNLYGPSEDTTYSTFYKIEKDTEEAIPIGKPIDNTNVYILHPFTNQLQPYGVVGEICISGLGVSRGYLNNLEQTNLKFIQNPFKSNEKLYKTGDLGKWMPDGNLEFIGRKDEQVKIRGYRIELGEIESVLMNFENVAQSVVLVQEQNGEKNLVAYLVSNENLDLGNVKQFLTKFLPLYMIPNYIIQIDALPLTPNGKVDKKVLSKTKLETLSPKEYKEPSNEIEKRLVDMWEDILNIKKIGTTDNFFELGGNSIKAVTIKNRINKEFNIDLQIKTFFQEPTIQNISELIIILSKREFNNFDIQEDIEEVFI